VSDEQNTADVAIARVVEELEKHRARLFNGDAETVKEDTLVGIAVVCMGLQGDGECTAFALGHMNMPGMDERQTFAMAMSAALLENAAMILREAGLNMPFMAAAYAQHPVLMAKYERLKAKARVAAERAASAPQIHVKPDGTRTVTDLAEDHAEGQGGAPRRVN
jgi:hypothetical protein